MAGKRDELIDRARALYASGMARTEVARALGVRVETLRKWAGYDAARGLPWDLERRQWRGVRPELVLRMLHERFGRMVLEAQRAGAAGEADQEGRDDAQLMKSLQILNAYRKGADDLTRQLAAVEEFAGYCADRLPPEQLQVVRGAVEGFLEHLRKENA